MENPEVTAVEAAPAQPAGEYDKLQGLLKSRKFWAALIGLGIIVLKAYQPDFPLSEAEVTNLVYVLIAYILGVAMDRERSA